VGNIFYWRWGDDVGWGVGQAVLPLLIGWLIGNGWWGGFDMYGKGVRFSLPLDQKECDEPFVEPNLCGP
jgi:hypothetical protein